MIKWAITSTSNDTHIAILDKYYKYGYIGRNILISYDGVRWKTIDPKEMRNFKIELNKGAQNA